ncbi:hypothetical protein LQF76_06975 [Gloeomargaritales cyanobacterium VI4D9]|nr:hypothetical protein LQF76_06975 [Gloeomargaritales cyanobacterium VI4D9]
MLGKFQREIATGKVKIRWRWVAVGVIATPLGNHRRDNNTGCLG